MKIANLILVTDPSNKLDDMVASALSALKTFRADRVSFFHNEQLLIYSKEGQEIIFEKYGKDTLTYSIYKAVAK